MTKLKIAAFLTLFVASFYFVTVMASGARAAGAPGVAAAVPSATPVAASFSTSVPANRQSAITLLGSDPDGTPLTYAVAGGPAHGALSNLNASTGFVVYTPTTNYVGADSFTYTVTSAGDTSPAGTVTLTVSAGKTHIVDTIVDGSGNPRTGRVTFILTQPVTTPGGIAPVGATVSAGLNNAGQFDVFLYPSRSLTPQAYYQVWFADASLLNRELIGVYDIPYATAAITLAPYKVTDTNLAVRYTFCSTACIAALQDSLMNVAAGGVRTFNGRGGFISLQAADLNGINGSGLTGIGTGTGGIINTGSTTIGADSDTDGVGVIALQVKGINALVANNDASVTIDRLKMGAGVPSSFLYLPQYWGRDEDAGNPRFTVGGGDCTTENYYPYATRISGDNWNFNKCTHTDIAYKNAALQGTIISPGAPGSWDESNTIDIVAFPDVANSKILYWYAGINAAGVEGWGAGWADINTPTIVHKDPANPIMTAATVQAALGGTVTYTAITEVVKINGQFVFYGYASNPSLSPWKAIQAKGTTWNSPGTPTLLSGFPNNGNRTIALQSVFRDPYGGPGYVGLYTEGSPAVSGIQWRSMYVATSPDGDNWFRVQPGGAFIQPSGSGWKSRWTHSARIQKDGIDPNNLTPALVNGKYPVYYSGADATFTHFQAGIMYLTAGFGRTPDEQVFSGRASNNFPISFRNEDGNSADAGLAPFSSPDGTAIALTSNYIWMDDGVLYQRDLTKSGAALALRPGSVALLAGPSAGPASSLIITPTDATFSAALNISGLLAQGEGATLTISSNAITPTKNIHHVSGGLLKNILAAAGFSGTIYLHTDGTVTTDNTGNIGSPPITVVAGKLILASRSNASSAWQLISN